MNVLDLLFSLFSYMITACAIENELGTVRTMFRFWVLGTLTLFIFSVFCFTTGIQQVSAGLWPMMFADLVLTCMKNPN